MDEQGAPGKTQTQKGGLQRMKAGTGSLGERFSQQPGWTGLGAGLWKGSLPMAGGWSEMGFKDPPNPTHSVSCAGCCFASAELGFQERKQTEGTNNKQLNTGCPTHLVEPRGLGTRGAVSTGTDSSRLAPLLGNFILQRIWRSAWKS